MTQPENKPEPVSGQYWWCASKHYGKHLHILNWHPKLIEDYIPRTPVLTPDEVVAKDAEIERLKRYLDASTKQYHEQRETIAELVAALDRMVGAKMELGWRISGKGSINEALPIARAALTKAKEVGK